MNSGSNGSFATLLLLVPVITVPLMAVFGVPEFSQFTKQFQKGTTPNSSPIDEWDAELQELAPGNAPVQISRPSRASDVPQQSEPQEFLADVDRKPLQKPFRVNEAGSTDGNRRGSVVTTAASNPIPRNEARPGNSPADRWATPEKTASPSVLQNALAEVEAPRDQTGTSRSNPSSRAIVADSQNSGEERTGPQGYRRITETGKSRPSSKTDPLQFPTREPLTWQAAVQRLNQMEIRNFRLEPGAEPGQFIFICSYTPPENPRVSYRFEAEAHEPLRAVEKVIDQIEAWIAQQSAN